MGARISLVVRATEAALRFVAPLAASKETERIVKEAESLRALAEAWRQTPPALAVRLEVAARAVRVVHGRRMAESQREAEVILAE